ncbi:hypothetical protein M885DRAFT_581107 [Pelagophyceae sp. CCMP2097]|nr:hypothetical protein M885DRAFT_581107 [Pelagophyceae sp. CCMP2097]
MRGVAKAMAGSAYTVMEAAQDFLARRRFGLVSAALPCRLCWGSPSPLMAVAGYAARGATAVCPGLRASVTVDAAADRDAWASDTLVMTLVVVLVLEAREATPSRAVWTVKSSPLTPAAKGGEFLPLQLSG